MNKFNYWQVLSQPSHLTYQLENSENGKLKGYGKWVWRMFGFTLIYFIIRNLWGMNTNHLTYLYANGEVEQYSFARFISFIGSIVLGIVFFLFYYYVVPYIIFVFTQDIEFRWIQKVQLYVIPVIIVEKLITLFVFAMFGFATPFTFFSLAPMVSYIYYEDVLLYFLNQLTVATVVTIWIQYTFLAEWEERKKALLVKLILIQFVFAILVACISILPISTWLEGWFNL